MQSLITQIDRLYDHALGDLGAAAGDLSLCAIAKSGTPLPSVKYHEGRVAMLRQIRMNLREGQIDSATVDLIRSGWEAKRPLAARSRDWAAYLSGGDDVIADLGLG